MTVPDNWFAWVSAIVPPRLLLVNEAPLAVRMPAAVCEIAKGPPEK